MKSIADIKAIRDKMQAEKANREVGGEGDIRVVVGMATCGIAAGARPVFNAFIDEVAAKKLDNVKVSRTGCMGMCKLEPIVEIYVPGQEKVTYIHVNADKAKEIVEKHIIGGNVVTEYLAANE